MREGRKINPLTQLMVERAAYRDAWRHRAAFTIKELCERYEIRDSYDVRLTLKKMVAEGELFMWGVRSRHGAPTLWFCAQETALMDIFTRMIS